MQRGAQLGPYELLSPLGSGGMGEVWRARDRRLARDVALKILPPHLCADEVALRRFEREAQSVASLSHPNVVAIFDVGLDHETPFVVTELLEGETLRNRLRRGPLDWRDTSRIGAMVAAGLAAAHNRGIIHRDLKPENVFLTTDGRVKILDFGLAKPRATRLDTATPTDHRYTQPGAIVGTITYMSPEQLRGEAIDVTSDIFSLGVILYEMLSGENPFERPSIAEVMAAILKEEPPPLPQDDEAATALSAIAMRCLEKNPATRIQSASEIEKALRLMTTDPEAVSSEYGRAPARRHSVVLLATAVALTAAIVIAIFLATHRSPQNETRVASAISSLAVLPFQGDGSPDLEYATDGITDSLITTLSRVPDVRVMSRSSVFRFKGRNTDPQEIGRQLHVSAILTGSMRKHGDETTVTAELVNTGDRSLLWSDSYSTRTSDLLTIENDVARNVMSRIGSREMNTQISTDTTNSEAHRLYLVGLYHWNRFAPEDLHQAIDYFQQAIARDPSYGLAYYGLSISYLVLGINFEPASDTMPKARAAALKAIEADPQLAEAYSALGAEQMFYEWDWAAAEQNLRRAILLKPGFATGHHAYAIYLVRVGRSGEAVAEGKRALELDPFSFVINNDLGIVYFYARRYDEAFAQMRTTLQLFPNTALGYHNMALMYERTGRMEDAIASFRRLLEVQSKPVAAADRLAEEYRRGGTGAYWRERTENLFGESTVERAVPFAKYGERDRAFALLEEAFAKHEPDLIGLKESPGFDPLRNDPRFGNLVRRMRFP